MPSFEEFPYDFLFAVIYGTQLELPNANSKDVRAGIQYAFSTLEAQEQSVLRLRYGERKTVAEAAVHLGIPEDEVRQLEADAFHKLRLPGRWNYIRYGVAGYMRKRMAEEYRKAFQTGYSDGYQKGVEDTRNGIKPKNATEEILNIPIENMGLSVHAYNCLRIGGCERVRDVIALESDRILRMRQIGPKTAGEIARVIQGYGLRNTVWDKFLL